MAAGGATVAAQLVEDCLSELDTVASFLRHLAYDEGGHSLEAEATCAQRQQQALQQSGGAGPAVDDLVSNIVQFLHGFESRVQLIRGRRTTAQTTPVNDLSAPQDFGATSSEPDEAAYSSLEQPRHQQRTWTFGASFKGSVFATTPPEESPLRRSISAAYARRRRSTMLVGMPLLSLDNNEIGAPPALNLRTTRHSPVLRQLADVKQALTEYQIPYLESVDRDEFNSIVADGPAFRRGYNGLPTLTVVAANVFMRYTFMQTLQVDIPKLISFFNAVDRQYNSKNPFHNSLHAANVVQAVHRHMIQPQSQKESLTDLQLCALLFSAVVLHVGHLGVHDAFLEATANPLTVIYPEGTQKSMSLAMGLALLYRPENHFLAAAFSPPFGPSRHSPPQPPEDGLDSGLDARSLHGLSASLASNGNDVGVNSFDMREDFTYLVSHLIRLADDTLHQELIAQLAFIQYKNYAGSQHLIFVLAGILRVANVSYVFKGRSACREWLSRSAAEGFREGSAQLRAFCRAHGIPLRSAYLVLEQAQIPPHLQPPPPPSAADAGVRTVDFFVASMEGIVTPLVNALQGFVSESWKRNLHDNIDSLSRDAAHCNEEILKRADEIYSYSKFYYSSGRHASALADIHTPTDFFQVIDALVRGPSAGVSSAILSTASRESGRVSALLGTASGRPADGLDAAAWLAPLRAVALLIGFVRHRVCKNMHQSRRDDPDNSSSNDIQRLVRFAKEWLTQLLRAENVAAGTPFLFAARAPLKMTKYFSKTNLVAGDLPPLRIHGGASGSVPNEAAPRLGTARLFDDETECLSLLAALDAGARPSAADPFAPGSGYEECSATASIALVVRCVVADLTRLCLDTMQ